jgi:hypothetical protein
MNKIIESPIPSATYTSVLMNCYNAVITNLNLRQYPEAMDCMQTFIDILKPEVRKDIKQTLDSYEAQIHKISIITGFDAIDTITKQRREIKRLMQGRGHSILRTITDALSNHGWLNRESTHPIEKANFEELETNAGYEEP